MASHGKLLHMNRRHWYEFQLQLPFKGLSNVAPVLLFKDNLELLVPVL